MIFLRTNDSANITTESGSFNFLNNNRKGNIVKKFLLAEKDNLKEVLNSLDLQSNPIHFFLEELQTKMIPKKSVENFKYHPVKLILTQNQNILVFQDFDCKISFLTFEDGEIIKKKFEDLIPEEDSILCYDDNSDDWYLDDIKIVSMAFLYNEEDEEDEEFKDIKLSNYIITNDNGGLIINNIFII